MFMGVMGDQVVSIVSHCFPAALPPPPFNPFSQPKDIAPPPLPPPPPPPSQPPPPSTSSQPPPPPPPPPPSQPPPPPPPQTGIPGPFHLPPPPPPPGDNIAVEFYVCCTVHVPAYISCSMYTVQVMLLCG